MVSVYKTPGRACSVALPSEQRHIRECAMEGPGPDLSNHHTILQLRAGRHSLSQFLVLWGKVLAVSTPASCSTNSHRLSYVYQVVLEAAVDTNGNLAESQAGGRHHGGISALNSVVQGRHDTPWSVELHECMLPAVDVFVEVGRRCSNAAMSGWAAKRLLQITDT